MIATYADREGKAWLSYGRLAEETGLHRATVMKTVTSLEADGFLARGGSAQGRGGRGRVNTWRLVGREAPLLAPEKESPSATLSSDETVAADDPSEGETVAGGDPSAEKTVALDQEKGRPGRPGTTIELPIDGSDLRSDPPPQVAAPTWQTTVLINAFLGAPTRQKQVGALIDLGRGVGVPLNGGRVAGIIKRHGHGQPVVSALFEAVGRRAQEPHDYMEKVLSHAKDRQDPTGRRQGRRAAPSADTEGWRRYAEE